MRNVHLMVAFSLISLSWSSGRMISILVICFNTKYTINFITCNCTQYYTYVSHSLVKPYFLTHNFVLGNVISFWQKTQRYIKIYMLLEKHVSMFWRFMSTSCITKCFPTHKIRHDKQSNSMMWTLIIIRFAIHIFYNLRWYSQFCTRKYLTIIYWKYGTS